MKQLVKYDDIKDREIFDYWLDLKKDAQGNILSIRFVEDYQKGLANILSNAGYSLTFVGCRAVEYTWKN